MKCTVYIVYVHLLYVICTIHTCIQYLCEASVLFAVQTDTHAKCTAKRTDFRVLLMLYSTQVPTSSTSPLTLSGYSCQLLIPKMNICRCTIEEMTVQSEVSRAQCLCVCDRFAMATNSTMITTTLHTEPNLCKHYTWSFFLVFSIC